MVYSGTDVKLYRCNTYCDIYITPSFLSFQNTTASGHPRKGKERSVCIFERATDVNF